jgi:hypothetical protein
MDFMKLAVAVTMGVVFVAGPVLAADSKSPEAAVVNVELPDNRHGLFGVTVVLEQGEELLAQYVGGAAVVPARDEGRFNEAGKFMASLSHTLGNLSQFHPRAFKRMGFDWLRTEIGWGGSGFEGKKGEFDWRQIDAFHDRVRQATYETPQCRNVAIGHALDALRRLWAQVRARPDVAAFVRDQVSNTRPAVARRARELTADLP